MRKVEATEIPSRETTGLKRESQSEDDERVVHFAVRKYKRKKNCASIADILARKIIVVCTFFFISCF